MKRIAESKTVMIGRTTLYLDDVEDIVDAMREVCDGDEVRIETSGHRFESVAALAELRQPFVRELSLRAGLLSPSFQVHAFGAVLHLGDYRDIKQRGLEQTIREICARHRSRWPTYALGGVWALAIAIIGTAFIAPRGMTVPGWVTALAGMLVLAMSIVGGYWQFKRGASVQLKRSHERDSFLTRNRDQIALTAIGAVLGAAALALVGIVAYLLGFRLPG